MNCDDARLRFVFFASSSRFGSYGGIYESRKMRNEVKSGRVLDSMISKRFIAASKSLVML